MDGAREVLLEAILLITLLVSILVLMDGAREGKEQQHQKAAMSGFNPCFDGWCSGRGNEYGDGGNMQKVFQSLF